MKSKVRVRVRMLESFKGQPVQLSSAVRLKCLDCCGNQKAEVSRCPALECPLWQYRVGRFTALSEEQVEKVSMFYEKANKTGSR